MQYLEWNVEKFIRVDLTGARISIYYSESAHVLGKGHSAYVPLHLRVSISNQLNAVDFID